MCACLSYKISHFNSLKGRNCSVKSGKTYVGVVFDSEGKRMFGLSHPVPGVRKTAQERNERETETNTHGFSKTQLGDG